MEERTGMGMDPKLEATLSYVLGFVTGLVFFFAEKENRYVRFHAMQSILTFGGLTVLYIIVAIVFTICSIATGSGSALSSALGCIQCILGGIIGLAMFVLWILLMIKAYQGERFKLPFVGDQAEKYSES